MSENVISMRTVGSTALLLLTLACGERTTAPARPAVATVTLSPSALSLQVGEQRVIDVTVRDVAGTIRVNSLVQWTSSAPTIATVPASSSGGAVTLTAVSAGTATITATVEGRIGTTTVAVTAPSPSPQVDFAIVDAQWTQAAQQADGLIPMVLDGNAAVLNVVMSSNTATRAPGQLLLSIVDSSGATVRSDTAVVTTIQSAASYLAPSAQFLLSATLLRPGLRWQLRRDPRGLVTDSNSVNDVFPRSGMATIATVALPTLRVRFVPIALSSHAGAEGNVHAANLLGYLPTVHRVLPMGRLVTSIAPPIATDASFGTIPSGGNQAFWVRVLQDLSVARIADTSSLETYWIGVVRPPNGFTFTSFGGFSNIPANPAAVGPGLRTSSVVQTGWFSNTGQTADLVAHELGHAFGRRHTPCGGPTGVDANYPTPDGSIGTAGHDVFAWASSLAASAAVRAASTGDLMGYCFPQWASPYTYAGMLNARRLSVVADAPSIRADPKVRQHVFVVRGSIGDGRVSLMPSISVNGFPTTGHAGAYRVELMDNDGRVIASQRVDPVPVDHAPVSTFVAAFPIDAAAAESIGALRVSGAVGTTTVGTTTVGSSAMNTFKDRANAMAPRTQRAPVATVRRTTSGVEVACSGADTAAVLVQDHDSGVLLASVLAPRAALATRQLRSVRALDVSCSDGVRTVRATALRARPSR